MKKKIIHALAAALVLLVAGCQKEDLPEPLTLKDTEITMFPKQEYRIEAGDGLEFSTGDEFVAGVEEDGTVTANHVGETVVTVQRGTETKEMKVTVISKKNLFPLPILEFGMSKSDIVKKLGKPTEYNKDGHMIYRNYSPAAPMCMYFIGEDGKMDMVGVGVDLKHTTSCGEFLAEHYAIMGEAAGYFWLLNAYSKEKATIIVSVSVELSGLIVIFAPYKPD
jgi:hypothetical protein